MRRMHTNLQPERLGSGVTAKTYLTPPHGSVPWPVGPAYRSNQRGCEAGRFRKPRPTLAIDAMPPAAGILPLDFPLRAHSAETPLRSQLLGVDYIRGVHRCQSSATSVGSRFMSNDPLAPSGAAFPPFRLSSPQVETPGDIALRGLRVSALLQSVGPAPYSGDQRNTLPVKLPIKITPPGVT